MKDLFGDEIILTKQRTASAEAKAKRNWLMRFQRWSDNMAQDGITSLGKCGYGSMCDYCNMLYKSPCVNALLTKLKEERKTLNYETAKFRDVWNGEILKKGANEDESND